MALELLSHAIMHIGKFFKLHHNTVRFRFFLRIANKRSISLAMKRRPTKRPQVQGMLDETDS